jgi:DNA-binding transcriptional regulator YiaG
MNGLRCSFPPYYVAAQSVDGDPNAAFPGKVYKNLERGYAPTAEECRRTLIELRKLLRWSRASLAAFLGVNEHSLRRWETGERQPARSARRLIWLADLLARDPDQIKTAFDLIVWGRSEEVREFTELLFKEP